MNKKLAGLLMFVIIVLLLVQGYRLAQKLMLLEKLNKRPLNTFPMEYEKLSLSEAMAGDYLLIDVREPEEYGQGHLKGALNYRTADLVRNPWVFEEIVGMNKTPVFYCYEGDYLGDGAGRSGLAAAFFNHLNLTAYSITEPIAEMETTIHWLGAYTGQIYPNEQKIRENPDAKLEVDVNHKNIFIRGQFFTNFTAGDMTTEEWDELLSFIGSRDVAITCYDNPTCFYANILGMRIEQEGGHYTYIIK